MKNLAILIFGLISVALYGQEPGSEFDGHKWESPYTLPVPKDWAVERFQIPISFAPQIPYKGVEDIRFTPGWAKANSDEYWSYAFLWYLEGNVNMDTETLNRNLKAYYTGLVNVNGGKIPKEKVIPVEASFMVVRKDTGDLKTFAGEISMLDYMGKMPIVLHCKVHIKSCTGENKRFIFYELSPKPLSHNIWLSLDKLWYEFEIGRAHV